MIGGVGRSGLVARAFEMRFTHLNKISYWERDFNTPSFQIGDVYIPITGIGNTYEALEGTVQALSKGADVMPITANRSSKLVALMRTHGRTDDIVFVPVKPEYTRPLQRRYQHHDLAHVRLHQVQVSHIRDQRLHIHQQRRGGWRRVPGDSRGWNETDARMKDARMIRIHV